MPAKCGSCLWKDYRINGASLNQGPGVPVPSFNVITDFGATGNGIIDDTAAIQAAFNACFNSNATEPFGGKIYFPGPHTYVVSSTIYAYDGCQIEGVTGTASQASQQPVIKWAGPASAVGTVVNVSAFTLAANSTLLYSPAFPRISGSTQNRKSSYVGTFTATNSLTAGQWVDFEGFSTKEGLGLNRCMGQVVSSSKSAFVAVLPCSLSSLGTVTDAGTATTASVVIAFDGNARYQQAVKNIAIGSLRGYKVNPFNVGLLFSSRVDTGTYIENVSVDGSIQWGYYFADGGINVDFDKGWRGDGDQLAAIYWRVGSNDGFGIANGSVDNGSSASTSGAAVLIDNVAACGTVNFTSRNMKIEVNTSIVPGWGAFTLLDCPASTVYEQFFLDFENTWLAPYSHSLAGFNLTSLAMVPPNDAALVMSISNGQFGYGTGANTSQAFAGVPALTRYYKTGSSGWIPFLSYSPPFLSHNVSGGSTVRSPSQIMGDLSINQLFQYGIGASVFLYSDTAYAALPNGTTLSAGQILAPPGYWSGANGKRYALDVVYQTGTTGTPNGGNTTCSGAASTTLVMTCTSATDLSTGQQVNINGHTRGITVIDATNPSAVLVYLDGNVGQALPFRNLHLAYSAPVLGPEIQLPTKSASAPSALAWSRGDMEQNSGATANGVAAWVNVAAGAPGTWAGIPLGNGSGQITASQIAPASLQGTDTKVLTAGTVSGTASPLCTDANGGATTSGCPSGSSRSSTTPFFGNGFVELATVTSSSGNIITEQGGITALLPGSSATINSASSPITALFTSGSSLGQSAGIKDNSQPFILNKYPAVNFSAGYSTSADYTANSRFQAGFYSKFTTLATLTEGDCPATGAWAVIRQSSTASDSTYQCVTNDGAACTVTAIPGQTKAPGIASMSISYNASGVTCTVNGVSVTNTTHLPTARGNPYGFFIANTYPGGGVTHVLTSGWFGFNLSGVY